MTRVFIFWNERFINLTRLFINSTLCHQLRCQKLPPLRKNFFCIIKFDLSFMLGVKPCHLLSSVTKNLHSNFKTCTLSNLSSTEVTQTVAFWRSCHRVRPWSAAQAAHSATAQPATCAHLSRTKEPRLKP